jgi:hypothetical protein
MAGKTISAYTDEGTATMVEHVSRIEQRKPSQIAAAALAFYVRLPVEAHAALRRLEAIATPEDLNLMRREVTRAISDASYHAAVRQSAARVREIYGDALQTDDEILAEAVRITSSPSAPGLLRVAEPRPTYGVPQEPSGEPGQP